MKSVQTLSVAALLFSFSTVAPANVYSFTSLPGAKLDGKPVSATAEFTTSEDLITLKLTNNVANPTSIIQALSDIFFTASGVTGGGGLKTPSAYTLITIGTDASPLVGNPTWLLTNTSGNNYHLDVLPGPATGPATLLIGPGDYTNANGSIKNNSPHNPFLQTSATWTLAFPDATANTVISNVVFSFGTTPGNDIGVPVPAAMWLFGSGLIGLVAIARRRHGGVMRGSPAPALTQ
jgi:hypothetical protein